MAEGTPRKRSRDPDSSCSAFQTPVSKRFRGFPSPSRKSRDKLFASQIQWSPSSDEETKENEAFLGKAAHSRKLEISPVPTAGKRESPGKSQKSHVPVGAFYGKGGTYVDPLERKRLRELQGLGDGNGTGNLPEKPRNSGRNPSRNRSSKGKTKPRRDRHSVPKGGKEKGAIPEGKENGNSGNCVVRKKLEWPLRVLSTGVRPALRLPLGSAFFSSGKRSHSRKNPGDPKSGGRTTQGTAPEKLEKSGSAEKSETVEGKGTLGRILEHQEEEKENREESKTNLGLPSAPGIPWEKLEKEF
uniref:Uncharacterized protein n=1 Tax=Malurus cyaneus samueli TaxID=2593467 RepID=A0A8C5U8N7_9PASS